jgi:hypothetical protein
LKIDEFNDRHRRSHGTGRRGIADRYGKSLFLRNRGEDDQGAHDHAQNKSFHGWTSLLVFEGCTPKIIWVSDTDQAGSRLIYSDYTRPGQAGQNYFTKKAMKATKYFFEKD